MMRGITATITIVIVIIIINDDRYRVSRLVSDQAKIYNILYKTKYSRLLNNPRPSLDYSLWYVIEPLKVLNE